MPSPAEILVDVQHYGIHNIRGLSEKVWYSRLVLFYGNSTQPDLVF